MTAMTATDDDSAPRFSFPVICRKKVIVALDGERLTSAGGLLLLAQAERQLGLAARLAACISDSRDPSRVVHDLGASCVRTCWRLPAA